MTSLVPALTFILLLVHNVISQEGSTTTTSETTSLEDTIWTATTETASTATTTEDTTIPIPAKVTFPMDILYDVGLLTRLGSKERIEAWIRKLMDSVEKIFNFSDKSDNSGLDTKIKFEIVNMEPYNNDVHCGQHQKVKCSQYHVDGVYMNPYNRSTGLLGPGWYAAAFQCVACTKGIMWGVGVGGVNNDSADINSSPEGGLDGTVAHEMGHHFGMPHDGEEFASKNSGHSYTMRAGGESDRFSPNSNKRYKQCYRSSMHRCMAAMET